MPERIPIAIVSGFLGSGKTTLVQHLLADARAAGLRLAVVSNELGELGIDRALLARGDEDYIELAGGCVCCRLSDELQQSLEMLWRRVQPDRIVVETSGAALPFDVQLQLWRDPVRSFVSDDVTVVVVNAEQLAAGRDLDGTFAQQVSSADLLLLNQVDRVASDDIPALESRLRALEPEAPILRSEHAAVEPALLFPPDPEGLRAHRRHAQHSHPPHVHEDFATEVIEVAAGSREADVAERIRELAALRAKGFFVGDAGPRLLQAVGPRVEFQPVQDPPIELLGKLVVIRRR
ncbi:MAG: GTP-binding protein [Myxococcales bacterium]|nr:GTP-binding protein [Myxococcales bacterium]